MGKHHLPLTICLSKYVAERKAFNNPAAIGQLQLCHLRPCQHGDRVEELNRHLFGAHVDYRERHIGDGRTKGVPVLIRLAGRAADKIVGKHLGEQIGILCVQGPPRTAVGTQVRPVLPGGQDQWKS